MGCRGVEQSSQHGKVLRHLPAKHPTASTTLTSVNRSFRGLASCCKWHGLKLESDCEGCNSLPQTVYESPTFCHCGCLEGFLNQSVMLISCYSHTQRTNAFNQSEGPFCEARGCCCLQKSQNTQDPGIRYSLIVNKRENTISYYANDMTQALFFCVLCLLQKDVII